MQSVVLVSAWTARALARKRGNGLAVLVVLGVLSVDLCAVAVGADDSP